MHPSGASARPFPDLVFSRSGQGACAQLGFLVPLRWRALGGVSGTLGPREHEESVEDLERVRRERDLYRRLLDLSAATEVEPFLQQALACIVEYTDAHCGYLELEPLPGTETGEQWWLAHGCSGQEAERIRASISRGIIAEALARGRTIVTHSALLDERFEARSSVRRGHIEAVLCVPIDGEAARGVVYLQGRPAAGPFRDEDGEAAERFARHLAPLAGGLLARRSVAAAGDPTHSLRTRFRLDAIVGRSAALASALEQAMLAAPLDVNVLLLGESGTGKTQLARAIHDNSRRQHGPFIEISCATIPTTLLESELFGSRAGARSEARSERAGKIAAAEHGTIFLDEVAELPLEAQAKLLQLLQSHTYYPLGANQPIRADVRLIAASNADLDEALRARRFRSDFYYRLEVLTIHMPALRERSEDLCDLAQALRIRVCERHRLPRLPISAAGLRALAAADWPGNVRQLENVIEAGLVRAAGQGAERVEVRHLFPERPEGGVYDPEVVTFQEATRRFQRDLLEQTLLDTDWNMAETARRLDLARSHIYNLVRLFGLARDSKPPRRADEES